ncbi:MAG TPA: uroporphyrinogen-III synthase [Roseiarcus sp.]|nr:uroporphyrinogen-III synthase [Roseiarcus sp.]
MAGELSGRRILVPEARELALLTRMLEERGAISIACPMVAIRDAPDPTPVEAWLDRFIARPCDDLILLTGEGLRRLLTLAARRDERQDFIVALAKARRVTRGPKPVRALREIGLESNLSAEQPTSEGVIRLLSGIDLKGRRVGVQLYPDSEHEALLGHLREAGAEADPVLPYVYASSAEDVEVVAAIEAMAAGKIDAVAFTSAPQVRRLREVAEKAGRLDALLYGLSRVVVASVGPVVASELEKLGARIDVAPAGATFFMKPLVRALVEAFERRTPKAQPSS